jgi:hypothetical protein
VDVTAPYAYMLHGWVLQFPPLPQLTLFWLPSPLPSALTPTNTNANVSTNVTVNTAAPATASPLKNSKKL